MTARSIADAFADAASRMTQPADVAGNLIALLADCAALTEADSAGLLVEVPGNTLELLSATSHTTSVLELYELQNGIGPCIEALQTNVAVIATGSDLSNSWSPVGRAIFDAGYAAVYAFPLRWGNHAVGALNLFAASERRLDDDKLGVGQAFANLAVAVLAHPTVADWTDVEGQIRHVLDERIIVEQAKGVLAVQHDLDLSEAFNLLVSTAARKNLPLAGYAQDVIASTRR